MTLFDGILVIIIIGYVIMSFRAGFIFKIGSLFGNFLGVYLAGIFYDQVSQKYFQGIPFAQVIAFGAIQVVTSFLIGLVFRVISLVFNLLAIIPGLKFINKTGGAVVGLLEILLISGLVLYVAKRVGFATDILSQSFLVPHLINIGSILFFLLPESLKNNSILNPVI